MTRPPFAVIGGKVGREEGRRRISVNALFAGSDCLALPTSLCRLRAGPVSRAITANKETYALYSLTQVRWGNTVGVETQTGRAKRAVLCWGILAARCPAQKWYMPTLDCLLEDTRWGPGKEAFLEGDLRVEIQKQFGHYIWRACWCQGLREDLWDRLGTAILARHSNQLPPAARFRVDLRTLGEWVCRPATDYSDWDKKACRRTRYEDPH